MTAASDRFATDICFLVPPFTPVHFPQLGTAVLKTGCQARGLNATIVYGNLMLAARIGLDLYNTVEDRAMREMVSDRLFRDHAYPAEVFAQLSTPLPLPGDLQDIYDRVIGQIEPVIEQMVAEILATRPRILGLSSTFQQNMVCSAVARRVKEAAPDTCVVMGGANATWPICRGLAEAFPWIDHFFAGESDIDFPDFCVKLIRDGADDGARVVRSKPITDMRTVSPPDFGDFFAALRPLQASGALPAWLPQYLTGESSRGCWWGAKSHCTFCGLNGDGMEFRYKSPTRMREELAGMAQWNVGTVYMTDNIMPRSYLTDLLPGLADADPRLELFYEVKANMTEAEVDTIAQAGITMIQPGVESLASDTLRLMRKGVSAHQNMHLLRSCGGVAMNVVWAIIYGFPGEKASDYAATVDLIPKIMHLHPPTGLFKIIIDRFSPLYRHADSMGIGKLSALEGYRALYPPWIDTMDIGYHFDGDYTTELLDDTDLLARLEAAMIAWRTAWARPPKPVLQIFERDGGALILDTRAIARRPMTRLTAGQNAALVALERPRARDAIDPAMRVDVDWLIAQDFLIDHEGKVMSIVVRPRATIKPTSLVAQGALEPVG